MSNYLPHQEPIKLGNKEDVTYCRQLLQFKGLGKLAMTPNRNDQNLSESLEIKVDIRETPRRISVAFPEVFGDMNIDGDGNFEYTHGVNVNHIGDKWFNMRVKGNGSINVKSMENNQNNIFKMKLRIKCDSFILFALPDEFNGNFDIYGDGNIQFTTHFDEQQHNISKEKYSALGNDSMEYIETETKQKRFTTDNEFQQRHRRKTSAYLEITKHKDAEPDHDIDNELLNPGIDLIENNNETITIDQTVKHDGLNQNPKSDETRRRLRYNGCSCSVLTCMTLNEKARDLDPMMNRFESFRNAVIASNVQPWHKGACLKCAIRYHYTFLLDKIVLPEFSDHLYEKGIIELQYYSSLLEMACEHDLDAKRSLLLHLSTKTICHDDFLHALYDSYMYNLVPKFYPGVNI